MVGRTISHYRIIEQIGKGGMGVVYRARDTNLRRNVALKFLPPGVFVNAGVKQRFKHEALALSRLSHGAVATLHDFISEPDADCIVMEFVAGESLDQRVVHGPLPEKEVLRLARQLADGLSAAHRAGVIHRDLKPSNIRITPDGYLKIIDFGLAKRVSQSSITEIAMVTEPHTLMGTLPYMAPELFRGEDASEKSDIYAAGIVLYEMATGSRPFPDLAEDALCQAVLNLDPPSPRKRNPALSRELEEIILRCMEKASGRRFASAAELQASLEALHTGSHSATHRVAPWPRSLRPNSPWVWFGGLVLLVAGYQAYKEWQHRHQRPTGGMQIHSLAVLPLENLSGDPEQQYFVDAMTDELINRLTQFTALRVIARASIMQYVGTHKSQQQIAGELHVDALVTGTVFRSGSQARISAQLTRPATNENLWAGSFEGGLDDVLALQNRVARAIAAKIRIVVTPQQLARLASGRRVDPIAYDEYCRGQFYWNRRGKDDTRRAIIHFTRAVEKDSLYAMAYSGLANSWGGACLEGSASAREVFPHAKQAALRALKLDPQLSEAYASLGNIQENFEWNWEAAGQTYRKAIELNDNNAIAHHWYAGHLALQGDFDSAMVEIRLAQELDPLSVRIGIAVGAFLYFARRYDEALGEYQLVAQFDSTSGLLQRALAGAYVGLGRKADAIQAIRRSLEIAQMEGVSSALGQAYAKSGFSGALEFMVAVYMKKRESGGYEPATHIAEAYTLLGRREQALHWLEVGLRERDAELNRLKVDPLFDSLRPEPRFAALLDSVGFTHRRL